jgi:hypothetical protein
VNIVRIKVANKSFENVVNLKYLEAITTNQNCIHEEIRSRLNSGNTYYHAVQNSFFFPCAVQELKD